MEKFIPYEKLSKKQQRERNKQRRGSWGAVNPVTRKPANPKAYNRQKARRWKYDPPERAFFFIKCFLNHLPDSKDIPAQWPGCKSAVLQTV